MAATAPVSSTLAPIAPIEQDSPLPFPSDIFFEIVAESFKPLDIHACRLSCRQIDRWMQNQAIWQRLFSRDFKGLEKSEGQSFQTAYRVQHRFRSNIAKGIYAANGTIPTRGTGRPRMVVFKDVSVQPHCVTFDQKHLSRTFLSFTLGNGKLFLGDATGGISIFDLRTGQHLNILQQVQLPIHSLTITGGMIIAGSCGSIFSPSVNDMMTGKWYFQFWDLESYDYLLGIDQANGVNSSIALGKRFDVSENIKIFDLESDVCLQQVEGRRLPNFFEPYSLISVGGLLIASKGGQHFSSITSVLRIWELESGAELNSIWSTGDFIFSDLKGLQFYMKTPDRLSDQCYGLRGTVGQLRFIDGLVLDFIAEDAVIFREIATLFRRDESLSAVDRFVRMPARARNAIYGKLYDILKPFANDYWGCGQDAFHDRHGQSSTLEQKALAIEAYLKGAS